MGCIYCATNLINGKRYIGKSVNNLNFKKIEHERDATNGSERIFHRALRKYGFESFKWFLVFNNVNSEELDKLEIESIKVYKTKTPNGYNMTEGGDGGATKGVGWNHSTETKQRMKESQKGRNKGKTFEEIHGIEEAQKIRKKLSATHKGRIFSDENKKKLSEAGKDRKLTEETKKKLSENIKKALSSPEAKAKMSVSQKKRIRKPHSEETKAKIGKGRKGHKHTDKTKKHLSQLFKGKTFEERYGKEKSLEIKKNMRKAKLDFKENIL